MPARNCCPDPVGTTICPPSPAVNCDPLQREATSKRLHRNDFLDLGAKPCALPRFPAIASAHNVYVRADGRDFAEDQALYQQFENDRMTCQSEGHSSNIPTNAAYHSTGDVGGNARDCMGKKGYTVVQSDVAELKRQDLAAKAAEKAQREAAAAAPPPPPPAPPKPVRSPRWGPHRNRRRRRRAQHPRRQAGQRHNRDRCIRRRRHRRTGPRRKLRLADRALGRCAL